MKNKKTPQFIIIKNKKLKKTNNYPKFTFVFLFKI